MGEGSRYFISNLWQLTSAFCLAICTLIIIHKHIYIHLLDTKDEKDNIDYPTRNEIILNEAWMTSYLEKEQQMNMKRLDQQETLLNITERLLDKLSNKLD